MLETAVAESPLVLNPGSNTGRAEAMQRDIALACKRIPPLWDLPNYVAVNPFLGFADTPFGSAGLTIQKALGAELLPPVSYYRSQWAAKGFEEGDLRGAAERAGLNAEYLEGVLSGVVPCRERRFAPIATYAEQYDSRFGTRWNSLLIENAARWCAALMRSGGVFSMERNPERGLYRCWREGNCVDRSMEFAGLRSWRHWMRSLPEDPEQAIAAMASLLEVDEGKRVDYFHRLLAGVYGWASYLRRFSWSTPDALPGRLVDLLAIRICGDAALSELMPAEAFALSASPAAAAEDEITRLTLQDALEAGYVRSLLRRLEGRSNVPLAERPAVQALFCIDVRSEPLRRHLEDVSHSGGVERVQTIGFAGFFGIDLCWKDGTGESARCPVLLQPGATVRPDMPDADYRARIGKWLKHLQSSPASAFSFVELFGLGYVAALVRDAFGTKAHRARSEASRPFLFRLGDEGIGAATTSEELDRGIDLAAGILRNSGLNCNLSRLVLFCGHQGDSVNNTHAAGLDCGACGGHSGAINARAAAALLNDRQIRRGLRDRGLPIPDDCHFLPALHHTATDEVTLLDTELVPATHEGDVFQLRRWLRDASACARKERAPALGLRVNEARHIAHAMEQRARDWSEVRPEWGLARNAAFIAARRDRTRGVSLEGRAFLHDYDWTKDPDATLLGLILSAPMMVASWINLQYYASTVDNEMFGCGSKALHNRLESLGVVIGNGGDLRTGLPMQSVHLPNGDWFHQPLRLQVLVEAPVSQIDKALAAHADVGNLVRHGWIKLYALDVKRPVAYQWVDGAWK